MEKIDLDKFIRSIMNFSNVPCEVKYIISNALKEQGIRFAGDDIIEERPNPKWYKCIKDYRGFIEGRLYCTNENGDLPSATGGKYVLAIRNPFFKEWFRPATEEEIKEISGNNEGISPNCELTEFEKAIASLIEQIDGDYAVFIHSYGEYIKKFAPIIMEAARKEVLKDLPKWKLNLSEVSNPSYAYNIVYDFESGKDYSCSTRMLECGNYRISISELLDKLPKEE